MEEKTNIQLQVTVPVNRKEFLAKMKELKDTGDHMAATLCELIPNIELMMIFVERANDTDVPYLYYLQYGNPVMQSLAIQRHHKEIWNFIIECYRNAEMRI